MKRLIYSAIAVLAFSACANDDVVSRPERAEIAFDNAFVENATRANDLTKGNFDFGVYASVVNSQSQQGMIFTNQEVKSDYTYSPTQYWIAGATYDFLAFAPFTNAKWSYEHTNNVAENGTITFDNEAAAANQDLLYAYITKTTPANITADPGKVSFTFNHMLSRVRFTFTNAFPEDSNIELEVTDVKITDAYKTGTLAVAEGVVAETWAPADKSLTVTFGKVGENEVGNNFLAANGGNASTEHFYLIPANAAYNVTFTVALKQAGVLIDTYQRSATLSYNMLKGNSYDIKANLNASNTSDDGQLYPIEFTVDTVTGWGNSWTNVDATVPATGQNNNNNI